MADPDHEPNYLELTREWLKGRTGKRLCGEHWNGISFQDLLTLGKEKFIGRISALITQECGFQTAFNLSDDLGDLYEHLLSHSQSSKRRNLNPELVSLIELQSAFESHYEDPYGTVAYFIAHLKDCHTKWTTNRDDWHSPYTALVQSSGYGKSRLCKEMARQNDDWLTVYICLRPSGSTGYPRRHAEAFDFLTGLAGNKKFPLPAPEIVQETKTLYLASWITAWGWIRIFHEWAVLTQKCTSTDFPQWMDKFITDRELGKDEIREQLESETEAAGRCQTELEAFWQLCENQETASVLHGCVKELMTKEILKWDRIPSRKVLFVLDEARLLSKTIVEQLPEYSLFRLFRGALRHTKLDVFAVLVDTTSLLSNFSPPASHDPSFRRTTGDVKSADAKLLSPFHLVTTTDVLYRSESVKSKERVFLQGRPLWKSTFDGMTSPDPLTDLRDFAWQKLSCNKDPVHSKEIAIAVLAVLTSLSISPISNVADELLGSHLATCLAIDDNRESMYIAYPVEPILAEAALHHLYEKCYEGGKLAKAILAPLASFLRIGVVNAGHNGELVVKILMLLIRRKVSKNFLDCDFSQWLKALCGKECKVPPANLSFTCFSKLIRNNQTFDKFWAEADPQSLLKAFYDRRAAMELPEGQWGADLLIPVYRDEYRDETKQYEYLLVQVKNVMTWNPSRARTKLQPAYVFPKDSHWIQYDVGWSLLINVGGDHPLDSKIIEQEGRHIVECNGLDIFKSSLVPRENDDIIKQFRWILREHAVTQWIENGDKLRRTLRFDPLCEIALNCRQD